tara:strand:- start:1770 stop:2561 length:792 start_codon:yes stop_codon:yes gene_type:complete
MTKPPDFKYLKVNCDGRRATLSLNRPEKLNALSGEMMAEITTAANWFDSQNDLRVVAISGAGRSFCAGFDVNDFDKDKKSSTSESWDTNNLGQIMTDALEAMAPVAIACLHGHVIGGGVILAAACDLRVATIDTVFSIPEVDLGIPLTWGGIPRLLREIGPAITKELVMTCRPFDANEAVSLGFLNRVVANDQLDTVTNDLAESIASRPKVATLATKAHINAVTAEMVRTTPFWSDTDAFGVAMRDTEAQASRIAYLKSLRIK